MDEHYRALMARPELGGVAAEARDARRGGRAHRAGVVGRPLLALGQRGRHRDGGHAGRRPVRRARPGAAWPIRRLPTGRPGGAPARQPVPPGQPVRPRAVHHRRRRGAARRPGADVAHRGQPRPPGPARGSRSTGSTRSATTREQLGCGSGYHRCGGRAPRPRGRRRRASPRWPERCPELRMAGPWKRYVGIDDGYVAAPVDHPAGPAATGPPIGSAPAATDCDDAAPRFRPPVTRWRRQSRRRSRVGYGRQPYRCRRPARSPDDQRLVVTRVGGGAATAAPSLPGAGRAGPEQPASTPSGFERNGVDRIPEGDRTSTPGDVLRHLHRRLRRPGRRRLRLGRA